VRSKPKIKERIQQAAGRVRRNEPLAIEDNEAEEEAIAADVKAMRILRRCSIPPCWSSLPQVH